MDKHIAVLNELLRDLSENYPDMVTEDEQEALRAAIALMRGQSEDVDRRALLWLAGGDSGMSSEAIVHHMLGMESDGSYPYDPADLGRCLRMLELFPEWKPRITEMAVYSKAWKSLADRWDSLAAMMADEVGIDWSKGRSAPRTYKAMKSAIYAKDTADEQ
jgi:hypothetical protein